MMCLQETAHLPLILGSNGEGTVTHIDGAHAAHEDMKGHVGVCVTEGKGAAHASSTKNELHTTSLTETESASVGEKFPKHLWHQHSRMAQEGTNEEDMPRQDNESCILSANNGGMSCQKGTKHAQVRHFSTTDQIKQKEMKIEHMPNESMIGDCHTKPVQGALLQKSGDLILGIDGTNTEECRKEHQEALERHGLVEQPS